MDNQRITFRELRRAVGLPPEECARFLALSGTEEIEELDSCSHPRLEEFHAKLAKLDAKIEAAVLNEVDLYTQRAERDTVLIRFLTDDDLALYEPDLFEAFGTAVVHGALISRVKKAIGRLGGEAEVAFMDSAFYEAWLGVNDFDDSRDLRIAWACQQMRGLS